MEERTTITRAYSYEEYNLHPKGNRMSNQPQTNRLLVYIIGGVILLAAGYGVVWYLSQPPETPAVQVKHPVSPSSQQAPTAPKPAPPTHQ